jgi:hypothetical protein
MNHKSLLAITVILFSTRIFSQEVDPQNFIAYINDDDVNIRNLPSIKEGLVISKTNTGEKIRVIRRTEEKDTINNINTYWFMVDFGKTRNISGWVFGKYISFAKENLNDFWNTTDDSRLIVSRTILYRNYFGDNLLVKTFGEAIKNTFDLQRIANLGFKDLPGDQIIDYLKESGYTKLREYKTKYGKLIAFVNTKENKWYFGSLEIENELSDNIIYLGMKFTDLTKLFGDKYHLENGYFQYYMNEDYDKYQGAVVDKLFRFCTNLAVFEAAPLVNHS